MSVEKITRQEAVETLWDRLLEEGQRLQTLANSLCFTVERRDPERAGEIIITMFKIVVECYTRLGILGALEVIE